MTDPPRYTDSQPGAGDDAGVGPSRGPRMPRWVKVVIIAAVLALLVVVIVALAGGHSGGPGPGGH